MPSPIAPGSEALEAAAKACDWLVRRQNRDGSWGNGSAMDKLVTTSHVTMTLLVGGYPSDCRPIIRAKKWLTSDSAQYHNNSYWTLAPLAYLDVDLNLKQLQLRKVGTVVEQGARPHPEQLVSAYFLRGYLAMEATNLQNVADIAKDDIIRSFSGVKCCYGRPDSTTDGYSALWEYSPDDAATLRDATLDLLKNKLVVEGQTASWGTVIPTSYTIMNIAACDLSDDPNISELWPSLRNFLLKCRSADGSWRIGNLPYGGTGDIVSSEYPTAVAARALMALLWFEDSGFRSSLVNLRASRETRKARIRGLAMLVILVVLGFAALTPFDDMAVDRLLKGGTFDVLWKLGGAVLAIFVAIFGIFSRLEPEITKEMWTRIKGIFVYV